MKVAISYGRSSLDSVLICLQASARFRGLDTRHQFGPLPDPDKMLHNDATSSDHKDIRYRVSAAGSQFMRGVSPLAG